MTKNSTHTQHSPSTIHYRIGIDCRLAGPKHAGIGRYIENLITRLPELDKEKHIQWIYFFHDRQQTHFWNSSQMSNIQFVYAPIRHYTVEEQLRMPGIFDEYNLDLLHIPHFNIPLFYPGKMVVTIHDLLWHEYTGSHVTTLPAWQYWLKHKAYRFVATQAIKKAAAIFVPAETVKKTIKKYYPQESEKIIVTKEGVGQQFLRSPHRSASEKPKYLVYVGSLYPHKNIDIVLQSLSQLPEYQLLLVGSRNVFQDQVRKRVEELGIKNQVQFLGQLSDEDLLKTFAHATALVQPSLSEGFGLTGVEAMGQELPVIASDIPIFKEIYQDGALYFSPTSTKEFIAAVQKLQDKSTARDQVKNGKNVVKEYSWETMAKETFESYLKNI